MNLRFLIGSTITKRRNIIKSVPKFVEDPNNPGNLIAMNDEAHEVAGRMNQTREAVLAHAGLKESEEINEKVELGPGWVKVPVGTPPQESMKQSYIAMGFSETEASIAAGIESNPHQEGSKQSIKESYMALGMSEAEANIAAGIER